MQLYTHPKLKLSIEEVDGIKYFKKIWSGIVNTVVFRDLIKNTLKIYKREIPKLNNPTDKILIMTDASGLELIRREDIVWLMEEIEPIYGELGLTHQALIPPKAMRIQDLVDLYVGSREEVTFHNYPFLTEEEGIAWYLESVKKEST